MSVEFKVRTENGELYRIPGAVFIEVHDGEGNLAAVLQHDSVTDSVRLYVPGDRAFAKYCKSFKCTPASRAEV